MKPDYTDQINAILAGSPIIVEANKIGVNMNTLRRILIKHPDYVSAKAEGKLHQKGYTPKLEEMSKTHPAVDEVFNGASVRATAAKHNLPMASLLKMVKFKYPDFSAQNRGKSPDEVAALAMKKAERALKRAQDLAAKAKVQP